MGKYFLPDSPEMIEELRAFLYAARIASKGTNSPVDQALRGSHVTVYEQGNVWRFEDEWYGNAPFSGFTKISYCGEVCWTMHYWGNFTPGTVEEHTRAVLEKALENTSTEAPWRGPTATPQNGGDSPYYNYGSGDITSFQGHEAIHSIHGLLLYYAEYRGGLVKR